MSSVVADPRLAYSVICSHQQLFDLSNVISSFHSSCSQVLKLRNASTFDKFLLKEYPHTRGHIVNIRALVMHGALRTVNTITRLEHPGR